MSLSFPTISAPLKHIGNEGYLYKTGPTKGSMWRLRWFCFEGDELCFFKEKNKKEKDGSVAMSDIKNIEILKSHQGRNHVFAISTRVNTLFLTGDKIEIYKLWVTSIEAVKKFYESLPSSYLVDNAFVAPIPEFDVDFLNLSSLADLQRMTSPLTSGKGRGATLESSQDLSRNSNPLPELDNILKNLSFSSQSLPTTPQSKSPRLTFSADSNFVRPARPKAPLPPESEDRTHRAPHPSLSPPSDHGSGHLRKSSAPASSKSPRTINHPFIESQTRSSSSSLAEQKKPRISPLSRGRTVKWVVEKTPAQLRFVEWEKTQTVQRVELNIGGKRFETTQITILSEPQSLLALVLFDYLENVSGDPLSHNIPHPPTPISFFFDRNPVPFADVLEFLRNGKCYARQEPRYIHQLRDESIYFHIPALTRYCDHCLSESTASSSSFEVSSPPTQPEVIET